MNQNKKLGTFITFEGGEGSGKTTQIKLLASYLKQKDLPFIQTREPGGTALGDQIRSLILGEPSAGEAISARCELFLYFASRAQHVTEKILPALKAGKIVLCDRFSDATIAYQADGRGLPRKEIVEMCAFASEGLVPDLSFFMDLGPEAGLARVQARGEINRMDKEALQFHEAVYAGYKRLMQNEPGRFITLDASQEITRISKKIQERVNVLLS